MSIPLKKEYDKMTGRLIESTGECLCGEQIDMILNRDAYDTIECPTCNRLYNSSGQELRPRDQWEENLEEDY